DLAADGEGVVDHFLVLQKHLTGEGRGDGDDVLDRAAGQDGVGDVGQVPAFEAVAQGGDEGGVVEFERGLQLGLRGDDGLAVKIDDGRAGGHHLAAAVGGLVTLDDAAGHARDDQPGEAVVVFGSAI